VQDKLRTHLPEGNTIPSTEKELRELIPLPQFRQIVSAFRYVRKPKICFSLFLIFIQYRSSVR
jgi:hypothetical protein